ncbi:MAG: DUF1080 domain-containing protein [Opitutus sp.]|nr:DUF1080 domain-containing protein [Opitutus sp.]
MTDLKHSGRKAEWRLSNTNDFLPESLAALRICQSRDEHAAAYRLLRFERGLHRAPVGDGCGEQHGLRPGDGEAHGLSLDLAGPLSAMGAGAGWQRNRWQRNKSADLSFPCHPFLCQKSPTTAKLATAAPFAAWRKNQVLFGHKDALKVSSKTRLIFFRFAVGDEPREGRRLRSMFAPSRLLRALLVTCALASLHRSLAQSALPPEPVRLDSLAAFKPVTANWQLAGDLAGDPRREKTLTPTAGTGVLVCSPGKAPETRGHLFTAWEHGDIEVDLEFLLTPGSNSGVYLQGRYEVQLFDSWGVREPKPSDCGGIYQRWDPARGKGNEGYEGTAPRANASRAPGLWQRLHLEFQAPRFEAGGKKSKNARFTKVVLNGYTIHENVEATGPTRSSAFEDEKPLGPLMIQGDHGAVALRNLAFKRFDADHAITTKNLHYKLYTGDFKTVGAYDQETPKAEGVPERFAHGAVEKSGKFALVFSGSLLAPREGAYRFAIETGGMARLLIDGRAVVVPLERGSQPAIVTLTAGQHDFRLDLVHSSNARPSLELTAEGPGLAAHALTVREETAGRGGRGGRGPRANAGAKQLLVEPKDRVLLQRGFVPFEPRKRLYAAAVGTPAGVHYAYDFETGALLHAWRGSFVDTFQMWDGRGNDQTAKPAGPSLTFNGKPAIGLIEYAANGDWPVQLEPLWSSQGYTLEADGTPVFLSSLAEISVRDRIGAAPDGRGLKRTLQLKGKLPSWSAWVLLAEADTITPQPDAKGWIIGAREWYLDWPAGAAQPPVVRTVNGKQQLAVPLTSASLEKPVSYSIVW